MGTPNAALFPNGLAVPDIDGANPSKLDPAGQVWEPREGWLRILGAWNINNVTRAPSPVPPSPAFGHIHISVPATLTGADPATTNPQAIMWNGAAWVDMTPVAYQCAMIKLGLPCAISTAAGNTVTVGPDGGIYVAGVSVPTVPLQTVSAPLVVTGTNIDIDFSLMSPADRMAIVAAICGDIAAKDALADCLVSASPGNALVSVGDGLFVPGSAAPLITAVNGPLTVAAGVLDINFCAMSAADIACFVSADAGNTLVQGSDGKLFVPAAAAGSYTAGGIVYDTPGTYTFTVPAGVTRIFPTVLGGGGGGGGAGNGASGGLAGNYGGGGGGGGLAHSIEGIPVIPGATYTVNVGAGGVAGGAGHGGAGGSSSIGALMSATGGAGGCWGAFTGVVLGFGGNGSGGDINVVGGPGGPSGPNTAVVTTSSANTPYALAGQAALGFSAASYFTGVTPSGYGGGGAGGSGGVNTPGGAGGPGLVAIRW